MSNWKTQGPTSVKLRTPGEEPLSRDTSRSTVSYATVGLEPRCSSVNMVLVETAVLLFHWAVCSGLDLTDTTRILVCLCPFSNPVPSAP